MPYQNLFVAKLPRNVNDIDLEQIFANYNPINAKVMLDASTGKSKGFGFVCFNSEEEGEKAYNDLNRKSTRACRHNFNLVIYPSQHNGKVATSASPALYIRNIPVTVPQAQVKQFLASFGNLLYCAMREDHHGNPVWVVYAEYDSIEGSKNALQKLHGTSHHFHGPPVMVKYADSEEAKWERRRRREEGKLGPAPASRSACVFPPPRHETDDANSTEAIFADLSNKIKTNGSDINSIGSISNTGLSCCVVGAVPTSESLASLASVGHNPSSGAASTVSSVHKESEILRSQTSAYATDAVPLPPPPPPPPPPPVYVSPPVLQPPMYPLEIVYPMFPPPHVPVPKGNDGNGPLNVIVLGDGQRLLVASNAVNVRPSNVGTWPANEFVWPMETACHPLQMQMGVVPPFAFVPFQ